MKFIMVSLAVMILFMGSLSYFLVQTSTQSKSMDLEDSSGPFSNFSSNEALKVQCTQIQQQGSCDNIPYSAVLTKENCCRFYQKCC